MTISEDIQKDATREKSVPAGIGAVNLILLFALGIYGLFVLYGLLHYFLYPAQYVFGTEVSGWTYASRTTFIVSTLVELILILGAVFCGRLIGRKGKPVVAIRLVVVLVLLAMYVI